MRWGGGGSGAEVQKRKDFSGKLEERKTFRPRWKSEEPVTVSSLQKLRDEFWDTAPHYGGERGEKPL